MRTPTACKLVVFDKVRDKVEDKVSQSRVVQFSSIDPSAGTLRKLRFVLGFFIFGLAISGITAFPLAREMELLVSTLGLHQPIASGSYSGLGYWIRTVYEGLKEVYAAHPWIAYGTDWLAFAHIIIAIFFIGPLIDPVRNVWILQAGLIACFLVVPLAMICGAMRGIPLGWRLIDCSFGVFGAMPLYYCLSLTKKLERAGISATPAR